MVSVYALLCAATVAQSDCTIANAVDVIKMPDSESSLHCFQDVLMTLASIAIQPQGGEYWKVVCAEPGELEIEVAKRHRDPNAPIFHRG
jgi:hypothetical protein